MVAAPSTLIRICYPAAVFEITPEEDVVDSILIHRQLLRSEKGNNHVRDDRIIRNRPRSSGWLVSDTLLQLHRRRGVGLGAIFVDLVVCGHGLVPAGAAEVGGEIVHQRLRLLRGVQEGISGE